MGFLKALCLFPRLEWLGLDTDGRADFLFKYSWPGPVPLSLFSSLASLREVNVRSRARLHIVGDNTLAGLTRLHYERGRLVLDASLSRLQSLEASACPVVQLRGEQLQHWSLRSWTLNGPLPWDSSPTLARPISCAVFACGSSKQGLLLAVPPRPDMFQSRN